MLNWGLFGILTIQVCEYSTPTKADSKINSPVSRSLPSRFFQRQAVHQMCRLCHLCLGNRADSVAYPECVQSIWIGVWKSEGAA